MASDDLPQYEANVRGRIKIEVLSKETRVALMVLKRALANEPGMQHVQVTFDQVRVLDVPPTVDVIQRFPHNHPNDYRNYEDVTVSINWTKFYAE